MTTGIAEISADLPCHRCGYNLRAHAQDAKCPECGEPVAVSRQVALIPRRPSWPDSDPRWRRRILAGVWILALMPLLDVVHSFGWISQIPVPSIFGYGARTLDGTLMAELRVDQPLLFCMGVVLLFSKERGRRPGRLDWTRRWGILCSYVTLLICAAQVLLLAAMVFVGISAILMTIPLKFQPAITPWLTEVSAAYLRHGPSPKPIAGAVLLAFSSVAILLACAALFDALGGSCPKRVAAVLIAPLVLFSLMHLSQAGLLCADPSKLASIPQARNGMYFRPYGMFFRPYVLVGDIAALHARRYLSTSEVFAFMMELAKWCAIFAIAVWLSLARFAPWSQGKKARPA